MTHFTEDTNPAISFSADKANIIADLFWIRNQCELRCLFDYSRWYAFDNKVSKIIIIRRASEQLFHLPDNQLEEYLISHNEYSEDMGNNMSNMKSTNALRKCFSIEFTRSLIANKEYLRAKVN